MSNIFGQTPYTGANFISQQRMYPQQQQMLTYALQPVSSKEEAVAARIEFASLGTIMPDPVHGVIYLKCFNKDTGGVDFITFAPYQEPAPPEYATAQDVGEMREKINRLMDEIENLKKPGKAVKKNEAEQ